MGYVPLFDHLTTGSLHGKWPDIGLWPIVLSMADRYGEIDVTPQYIAGVTGLPLEDVIACLDRFCAPDPYSRTIADEGRRLALLDPARQWGWKVLNHSAYREKARLMARDAQRTASGEDAARKRAERECPPPSPELPPSDSDTDLNKDKEPEKRARPRKAADGPPFDPATIKGLDLHAWTLWVEHRKAIKKPIRPHSMVDAAEELAKLGDQQLAEVKRARAGGWQGIHPDTRRVNGDDEGKRRVMEWANADQ